jgi:hypothetical protein
VPNKPFPLPPVIISLMYVFIEKLINSLKRERARKPTNLWADLPTAVRDWYC